MNLHLIIKSGDSEWVFVLFYAVYWLVLIKQAQTADSCHVCHANKSLSGATITSRSHTTPHSENTELRRTDEDKNWASLVVHTQLRGDGDLLRRTCFTANTKRLRNEAIGETGVYNINLHTNTHVTYNTQTHTLQSSWALRLFTLGFFLKRFCSLGWLT